MKKISTRFALLSLTAAALTAMSVGAWASQDGERCMKGGHDKGQGMGHEMGERKGGHGDKGMHGKRMDMTLQALATDLKLTDAQKPAFAAFEKTVKELQAQHADMKAEPAKTWQDRMAHMETRMKTMQTNMGKMREATQTLAAQLTPEQQSVLNEQWMNHDKGHDKGHGEGKRGHDKHDGHRG